MYSYNVINGKGEIIGLAMSFSDNKADALKSWFSNFSSKNFCQLASIEDNGMIYRFGYNGEMIIATIK